MWDLFKLDSKEKRDKRYKKEREIASGDNSKKRLTLAKNNKTHQEILYYLAEKDPDPTIRKAVASNKSTPVQATSLLAKDPDVDVRLALAERLLKLLPNLSNDKQSQVYAYAVQSLSMLALDQVIAIRRALSSALKDLADAPPHVAGQLAKDVEREVAEPILRFCVSLSDDDLLEVLSGHVESWAVQAIAARPRVSEPVSDAVIETGDVEAGKILMENEGALLSDALLEKIVERAKNCPEWHEPLAGRNRLPPHVLKTLIEFADTSVRAMLEKRGDLDGKTVDEVSDTMRRRLDYVAEGTKGTPTDRVQAMLDNGGVDEDIVSDALGMQDFDFVIELLVHQTDSDKKTIDRVLSLKSSKAVVALAWRARLSMRMALKLQQELAKIPHSELIYPRNGTDYPLTQDEILWQLDFLDISRGSKVA